MKKKTPPVELNEQLNLRCLSKGKKGDGIFKTKSGYILIVKDAVPDKEYRLKVTKVTAQCGFAEIMGDAA